MGFADHLVALDAQAFVHLADDTAAVWTCADGFAATLGAMLDTVERPSAEYGVSILEAADIVRFALVQIDLVGGGRKPSAGDTISVRGRAYVLHGEGWRENDDWLCPVSR
jgi:hypothetical protein